jgi:hypothetical protein
LSVSEIVCTECPNCSVPVLESGPTCPNFPGRRPSLSFFREWSAEYASLVENVFGGVLRVVSVVPFMMLVFASSLSLLSGLCFPEWVSFPVRGNGVGRRDIKA